ncbi:MAG: hypothetical protein HYU86_01875 [Chloroflexi bacterium]|nr:hypothetical protein [Chloroflexota bacterium]
MDGYAGRILRVDLSQSKISSETVEESFLRQYVGGTCLLARYLYEEVPPGVAWSHPDNRLMLASGPLAGTTVGGSGTFSVVTKGALTEGATATQANGFWGAYLKFSGFDAIIIQGASPQWVYLYIHDGTAELRDAAHLVGKDTWETEDLVKADLALPGRASSVFGIGPAGENRVRFAAIVGDRGHVAAHNGVGAVAGAKKLKAIAVARSRRKFPLHDAARLSALAKEQIQKIKDDPRARDIYDWGTLNLFQGAARGGWLPTKNYTTNRWPFDQADLDKFTGPYIRSQFQPEPHPCWACQFHHCHLLKIPSGPWAGRVIEEPEYEGFAACASNIGVRDVVSAMVLANEVDRLGMDVNEAGWVMGFAMEAHQKGLLDKEATDRLELTWGNSGAAMSLLSQIAHRRGLGDLLAEGVMRAAQRLGGEAINMAVHTQKGASPRGHDHRARWVELFDTCVSSSGTIETVYTVPVEQLGHPPLKNAFSPEEVATFVAVTKGAMQFEDSLGVCRFQTRTNMEFLTEALQAATGWEVSISDAMAIGRKAVNTMRAFDLRHGISPAGDRPSPRYGSSPVDGPAQGRAMMPHWEKMLRDYYQAMGWDAETGVPLPATLESQGLDKLR